ncbi:Tachykinin-like peptide receptor 99D [Orchesella cincta]|uniref:Tachykinin-like peptide receptor 99D n=1 Tax=Orchesella cincta TaxID=48709 RepID=A0A1D2NMB6_ORCCI|nr:Tachykinin-like peptide receptor 99D [Orchesella cincta]
MDFVNTTLLLLLAAAVGQTRWFVSAEGATYTFDESPLSNNRAAGFHQGPHQNHPPSLFSLSTTSSYLMESRWQYAPDDDDDNGKNHYGNNNINYNNNSTFGLMTGLTVMGGNESMESSFGGTAGANGTESEEMDEDEEGAAFQAAVPWWRQIIWSILFGAMVVVACTGNVTVIWIVLAHKRMRTVTNYLLVNLSIADAMSSTLNVIPNYSYMLTGHWPFGALYCKIVQFVSMLSICASVFSLMAIAFDRYMAIMNPLRPRMGKRLTLGIAAAIWIGGTILSMPMLVFFQTYEKIISNGETIVICYSEWPDGPQTQSFQEYLYNVFFMIFTYFIPIAVMGYTYTRVGIELWGSKSIGECTQRQLDNIKSKRRVVKMMIVVVTIFAFCWLPFHMYFILVSLSPNLTNYQFVQEVYLGIYWLAMSNSMYNPIIYCWMNNRFRRGFQQVFRWCPFVHYSEVEGTTAYMMHTQRERETTRYSVTGSPEYNSTRVSRNGLSVKSNFEKPPCPNVFHRTHHKDYQIT